MGVFFSAISAAIHVYIFWLESCRWGSARTNRVFGVTKQEAEINRLFAFNQGFYNLFLAIAVLSGLAVGVGDPVGRTLALYGQASMLMAALVLISSNRRLWRAALVQGLPAILGLVGIFLPR